MRTRILLALAIIVALFAGSVVQAQDSIAYGDTVSGEITASEFEFEYAFSGEAGDVVVFNMLPVDIFGDLDNPQIDLLGADGALVASTANQFNFGRAALILELPESGDYTLIATREDGRSGDSVGEFTLEAILVEMLELGAPVSGSAETEARVNYYGVMSESEFALSFIKTGGDMPGEVKVNVITEDFALEEVAVLNGSQLTEGIFGIFGADTLYVVTVGEPEFYFAFDTETLDYDLELVTFE